ncbi:hypothetical protein [Limnobacter sp.]|uniref:hypothetical protein n=1 Tax=Limnobacter sp. TaxID=2003368 RepID=UPI0035134A46
MNKRALVYLGLASATLAGAYVYMQTQVIAPPSTAVVDEQAQSMPSVSIRNGQLLTEAVRLQVRQGKTAALLVFIDQDDELLLEGSGLTKPLVAGKTNAVAFQLSEPGLYDLVLVSKQLPVGQINVLGP